MNAEDVSRYDQITGDGCASRNTTVCGSGVSTATICAKVGRAIGWTFLETSMIEYCTSADVNGTPSCHFTSLRNVNVIVRRSADSVHDVASCGTGRNASSYVIRPSNRLLDTTFVGLAGVDPAASPAGSGSVFATSVVPVAALDALDALQAPWLSKLQPVITPALMRNSLRVDIRYPAFTYLGMLTDVACPPPRSAWRSPLVVDTHAPFQLNSGRCTLPERTLGCTIFRNEFSVFLNSMGLFPTHQPSNSYMQFWSIGFDANPRDCRLISYTAGDC